MPREEAASVRGRLCQAQHDTEQEKNEFVATSKPPVVPLPTTALWPAGIALKPERLHKDRLWATIRSIRSRNVHGAGGNEEDQVHEGREGNGIAATGKWRLDQQGAIGTDCHPLEEVDRAWDFWGNEAELAQRLDQIVHAVAMGLGMPEQCIAGLVAGREEKVVNPRRGVRREAEHRSPAVGIERVSWQRRKSLKT
jgi:hypothetical protein